MSRPPVTAAADDYSLDAGARIAGRGSRHLPVVDGDCRVVGMLSDRDVRIVVGVSSRPRRRGDAVVRARSLRVADAMTRDVFVVR